MILKNRLTDITIPVEMTRLTRTFYQRNTVTVARALLGQRLVCINNGLRTSGIIVETEAYLGVRDLAAHTCNGRRTTRNHSMWQDGGTAYIYFTYGMHYCMNVVSRIPDVPEAVLIRALEPVEGLELIRRRRPAARRDTDLCSGPAKLCQALAIDRTLDGTDLVTSSELFIEQNRKKTFPNKDITVARRIGVDYAGHWADKPLRFYLKNNPHVSKP